jgi:hypothetical protein
VKLENDTVDFSRSAIKSAEPGNVAGGSDGIKSALEDALKDRISEWFPTRSSRTGLSISLIGLHVTG